MVCSLLITAIDVSSSLLSANQRSSFYLLMKIKVPIFSHYPVNDGHPCGRKIYFRIKNTSTGLLSQCNATTKNCIVHSVPKRYINRCSILGALKLFQATAQLKSLSTEVLVELICTRNVHKYVLMDTGESRYKLMKLL